MSHSLHSGDATGFHTFATWRATHFYSLLNHEEEVCVSVCVRVWQVESSTLTHQAPPNLPEGSPLHPIVRLVSEAV